MPSTKPLLHIDGSQGEAGGQIIRTALALSAITNTPFTIEKIRHNRPKRGLKTQHLTCVRELQKLTNATVEGATLGSETLTFTPTQTTIPNELTINIGTAGSITLLLQALLPLIIHKQKPCTIHIKGGTNVAWSPPIDYTTNILFPTLTNITTITTTIRKRGCYPKGGGHITLTTQPKQPKPILLTKKGNLISITGHSFASNLLKTKHVAERTATKAKNTLTKQGHNTIIKTEYTDTESPGSGITLWATYEHCIIGADTIGERGKPAEKIGEEAANKLITTINTHATTDPNLTDQLIPYLALYTGTITTPKLTNHTKTNIAITEQFLKKKFIIKEENELYTILIQ